MIGNATKVVLSHLTVVEHVHVLCMYVINIIVTRDSVRKALNKKILYIVNVGI